MDITSSPSSSSSPSSAESCSSSVAIPVEIITDDEMAFIEAALASTRPLLSSLPMSSLPLVLSPARRHVDSIRHCSSSRPPRDIEDIRAKSLLERFRDRRALTVTAITGSEWCEKQMEFGLVHGKPKKTAAMEAGSNRHAELEKEVIKRIDISIESPEETWAVKFFNFIVGTKQLLLEGLTRELPVIGVFRDTWIVGVIDELRMPLDEAHLNPILVDTKTRNKVMLPTEAQKRNSRLQLMCYKYLWDGLAAGTFPFEYFFKYFELNPHYMLSEDVKQYSASLGLDAKTFEDVVTCFSDSCSLLPPSHDQLLLRYELQSDCSLLEEDQFAYDACWLMNQIEERLKFWLGEREAQYVSEAESWKCRFCTFNTRCPKTSNFTSGTR